MIKLRHLAWANNRIYSRFEHSILAVHRRQKSVILLLNLSTLSECHSKWNSDNKARAVIQFRFYGQRATMFFNNAATNRQPIAVQNVKTIIAYRRRLGILKRFIATRRIICGILFE